MRSKQEEVEVIIDIHAHLWRVTIEGHRYWSDDALAGWAANFSVGSGRSSDDSAAAKLAAQYDTYRPFPDLPVNGKQTLAENIADVAGISAAYDGYVASLGGKTAPAQDGFSGNQQFFIAFGQNWGSKSRDAALRQQVMTDPHSPAQYRAATVRNIDAWYGAFDVQSGQTLYLSPADRVKIW